MKNSEGCVFCPIIHGLAPATVVYDSPLVLGIVPLNPVTEGHVIFMPKVHKIDFVQSGEVSAYTMQAVSDYAWNSDIEDCNVITSRGKAATQSVFHLHIHVVPRTKDDGLHLPWTGQTID